MCLLELVVIIGPWMCVVGWVGGWGALKGPLKADGVGLVGVLLPLTHRFLPLTCGALDQVGVLFSGAPQLRR